MINVLLEAPIMTQSGYGEHSRLVFRALRKIDGVKLYVSPLEWGATSWASSFDKQEVEDVQSCINDLMHAMSNNMQPNFDVQIHVGILNEFEKKAPYSICVTAGVETDRVSAEWLIRTYKGVNKIITPSEHAASGFRDTSYTAINQNTNSETLIECNPATVVDVVPYPVKQKEVKSLEFNLDTEFNFLSVALLGPRKNIELMCKWFVEEFKDDNVGLVVKTGRSRGSIIDKNHTRSILKPHINLQGKKCKVYLLHGSLEESEIHSLYKRNDIQAYVTATSGEGFGLPVFEAAYSGMPIVATDWSAHTEFLSAPYREGNKKKEKKLFAKVDYELQPIPPHVVWKDILVEDSRWAIPKENSFKKQLRNMYKNYGMYKKWAKVLQDNLLKTHENDLILDNMSKAIIKDLPPEISFISDFFVDEVSGGAELVDEEIIKHLSKRNEVVKIKSYDSEKIRDTLSDPGYYIVSNFTGMSEDTKSFLQKQKYSICEHDHKYLINRDPSPFPGYRAPNSIIINREFYRNAENVFCQSKKHKDVVESNLGLTNIINLGCSIWSEEELSILRANTSNDKNKEVAVFQSNNEIKGTSQAIEYCNSQDLDFDLVGNLPYEDFLKKLSKYEKLVFFPTVLESFSRLAVEARILNCQLITNQNLGCASEEWFREKRGTELLDFVESKRRQVLHTIERATHEEEQPGPQTQDNEITVILNSYRRPYNLEMQIKAIREQSTAPVQIWLWVNHHEDNEGFDYSALGFDRIFKNDHNWKFYGRFAAALLVDTKYVAIFDDDTIPGRKWFQNCLSTMNVEEGILGSAGVTLNDKYYVRHDRCGWPVQNKETMRVDLVGHAWFFKREWLQFLWREKPTTWDNGEDIQFSYLSQKYGNIQTFCPPHPPEDKELHGSILGNELGIDNKATSTNSAISHKQFFSERDFCVQTALKGGWQTVKGIQT